MKILVTANENYIYPLKVMLYSLFSTQEEPVTVFLAHTEISASSVGMLRDFCHLHKAELLEVRIEEDAFENAPVMRHFSKEMYYRLLAPWLLPNEDRVLYLDPDIIINGSLRGLWEMELDGALMAVVRDRAVELLGCNVKHELKKDSVYFNSGVLLMDLKRIREEVKREEISALIAKWNDKLEFPDQDILNLLYEGRTKLVEDAYNLMAALLYLVEYLKTWSRKKARSLAKIVHYVGPNKPWNGGYRGTMYSLWARAEWYVHPSSRLRIAGRLLLEPYRFVWGLWEFAKNHNWKRGKPMLLKYLKIILKKTIIKYPLALRWRREETKSIVDADYCLPYIEMRVTTRCNMKCKHCGHLIPRYGSNASDLTFQDFKKHFDRLINAVSFIKVFSLVGGETPLSRYLIDIVKYVLESQKIGEIRIVSNGKELPPEDLLKLIGNTRAVMHFSQYEMNSENYPVIRALCQKYHVQTFFYHDEPSKQFWYDYGEVKDYHHSEITMTCTSYDCYLGGVKQYTNGKLFQCPRLSNAYDLGLIDFPESDLLEITDDVEESRKNLRELYSRRYSYGCRYCNAPKKKKIRMAEQLE